jgi:putative NADH-flavin reductase
MKTITIFGASGRTGKEVKSAAEKNNIIVRTFDRKNPAFDDVRHAVSGSDAVIIVFGPHPPYKDIFCAEATKKIVRAMQAEGVRRLICQTGAMIGDYRKNRSAFFEMFSQRFRKSNPTGHEDRVMQEQAVKNSSLDWTIIKPPRLTMRGRDLKVKSGQDLKVGMLSSVFRRNIAKLIISEILEPQYIGKAVFVKN